MCIITDLKKIKKMIIFQFKRKGTFQKFEKNAKRKMGRGKLKNGLYGNTVYRSDVLFQ